MAVVAVGAIMRGSGVGMPSSRGEHVSRYPVVRWAAVQGGLQKKERELEVSGSDDVTPKFSTGGMTDEITIIKVYLTRLSK